jgi:hypothetical protein
MPGDYSTRCLSRPHPASRGADATTARFFLCAGCRVHVFVCRRCDRGQIYCAGTCAQEARQRFQQEAGRRYQASLPGRMKRAARNMRYRARQKIVTHQGSPPPPPDDVVLLDAGPRAAVLLDAVLLAAAETASTPAAVREVVMRSQTSEPGSLHCHWCGERCSPLLRNEFLRRRQRGSSHDRRQRKHHDHPS